MVGMGKAPLKDGRQKVLEAEVRAIDRVENMLIGLQPQAGQGPDSLLADESDQLQRCNRLCSWERWRQSWPQEWSCADQSLGRRGR